MRGAFRYPRQGEVVRAGMNTPSFEASGRATAPAVQDPLRPLVERLPRPFRFIFVGSLGLVTDFGSFSALVATFHQPLMVRVISIGLATLVTWRLNRALTFDASGRRQHHEALRYALVTACAQGLSYLIFASLVLTVLARLPHAALLVGNFIAAFFSYYGHRLFAFAPADAPSPPAPSLAHSSRRTETP